MTITDTKTEVSRATFEEALAQFIPALNAYKTEYYKAGFKILLETGSACNVHTVERGRKYVRVVVQTAGGQHRSSYCFLDYQGNIYKCEGWKKPAKHIRGTIWEPNFSLGRALQPHGAVYLK